MKIEIRPIETKDYKRAYAFQWDYLDQESYEDFVKRAERTPDLYLVALDGDDVIGVCYGHPSERAAHSINLQGIAVNLDEDKDYARKGIGSNLLRRFEEAVRARGYSEIGLGAADDLKVEKFYLKNGFEAYELVAKDDHYQELERVPIMDYASGKTIQEALREKHLPREVIFIFRKFIEC